MIVGLIAICVLLIIIYYILLWNNKEILRILDKHDKTIKEIYRLLDDLDD